MVGGAPSPVCSPSARSPGSGASTARRRWRGRSSRPRCFRAAGSGGRWDRRRRRREGAWPPPAEAGAGGQSEPAAVRDLPPAAATAGPAAQGVLALRPGAHPGARGQARLQPVPRRDGPVPSGSAQESTGLRRSTPAGSATFRRLPGRETVPVALCRVTGRLQFGRPAIASLPWGAHMEHARSGSRTKEFPSLDWRPFRLRHPGRGAMAESRRFWLLAGSAAALALLLSRSAGALLFGAPGCSCPSSTSACR